MTVLLVVFKLTDVDLSRFWVSVRAFNYVSFVPFSLVQLAVSILKNSVTFWKIIAYFAPVNTSIHAFDRSITNVSIVPTTLDHATIVFVRELSLTMRY
jgi:hypothetical protein